MSTWNLYDLISAVATGASTGAAYYAKRDATRGDPGRLPRGDVADDQRAGATAPARRGGPCCALGAVGALMTRAALTGAAGALLLAIVVLLTRGRTLRGIALGAAAVVCAVGAARLET